MGSGFVITKIRCMDRTPHLKWGSTIRSNMIRKKIISSIFYGKIPTTAPPPYTNTNTTASTEQFSLTGKYLVTVDYYMIVSNNQYFCVSFPRLFNIPTLLIQLRIWQRSGVLNNGA